METTGACDRIQVSQETAELLVAAGRSDWLTPRDAKVEAKGKGELQTYWLSTTSQEELDGGNSTKTGASSEEFDGPLDWLLHQWRRNAPIETPQSLFLPHFHHCPSH